MDFMLPFQIAPPEKRCNYQHKIFFLGSCFSTDIAARMRELKFSVFSNPTGIVYHPLKIADVLRKIVDGSHYSEYDLVAHNGLFHSWEHHSEFSEGEPGLVLQKANHRLEAARQFLAHADFLILSPATAFGYYLKEGRRLVSNCHKLPAVLFDKQLSEVAEITDKLTRSISLIKEFSPGIRLIFTVSPVKHLRDGVVANNLSKAIVIQAVHKLVSSVEGSWYFPSFEILNDELRDYRFYKNDFAHPSDTAVSYILEKFLTAFISDEAKTLLAEIRDIRSAAAHRPMNRMADAHRKFCEAQLHKIAKIEDQYPFLDFSEEKSVFTGG